jgi:UDP-glucose 4-epimerase
VHLPELKEGDMTRRQPDITRMKELQRRTPTSLEDGINALLRFRKIPGFLKVHASSRFFQQLIEEK